MRLNTFLMAILAVSLLWCFDHVRAQPKLTKIASLKGADNIGEINTEAIISRQDSLQKLESLHRDNNVESFAASHVKTPDHAVPEAAAVEVGVNTATALKNDETLGAEGKAAAALKKEETGDETATTGAKITAAHGDDAANGLKDGTHILEHVDKNYPPLAAAVKNAEKQGVDVQKTMQLVEAAPHMDMFKSKSKWTIFWMVLSYLVGGITGALIFYGLKSMGYLDGYKMPF
ncbi:unnamed protein product [Peronospora belbahrii]|uniref:RxLR effector protein n=1 Tax=Peronospora belbahrii TaxID=622444 RepID=A0AAU9L3S8_9STRA|nr:unnamed protein product [Peronospora belbahrii]